MADPTIAARLALALCPANRIRDDDDERPCDTPCLGCRRDSAAVAHELAQILRERHGGSSSVADWLDGLGNA